MVFFGFSARISPILRTCFLRFIVLISGMFLSVLKLMDFWIIFAKNLFLKKKFEMCGTNDANLYNLGCKATARLRIGTP